MADLANVNAPHGVRPPAPFVYPGHGVIAGPGEGSTLGSCDVPVVLEQALNPATLDKPRGLDRQQCYGVTFGTGMLDPFALNTGAHGIVPGWVAPPDMAGGQEPWRSWNPRTLRHEPTRPWDDGIYQGNAS